MKNKKTSRQLLLIGIVLWNVYFVSATPQSPDYLIINQDTIPIYTYLFEEKEHLLQRDRNYMRKNQILSDCWRTYVATWEIQDGALYLLELAGCSNSLVYWEDETMRALLGEDHQGLEVELIFADLSLLFPDKYEDGKVLADWYTGMVTIPKGAAMYYENRGYSAIFEFEHEMSFEEGILIKEITYDNRKASLNYFEGDLRNFVLKNLEEDILQKMERKALPIYVIPTLYFNAKQRIIAVKYQHHPINNLEKKIKKLLLKIRDWNVYYKKGKPVLRPKTVYFYFDKKVLSEYRKSKAFK